MAKPTAPFTVPARSATAAAIAREPESSPNMNLTASAPRYTGWREPVHGISAATVSCACLAVHELMLRCECKMARTMQPQNGSAPWHMTEPT
ncbi:MAG: hypothetical protein Kow0045_00850 [Albidovulum sp.]